MIKLPEVSVNTPFRVMPSSAPPTEVNELASVCTVPFRRVPPASCNAVMDWLAPTFRVALLLSKVPLSTITPPLLVVTVPRSLVLYAPDRVSWPPDTLIAPSPLFAAVAL